MFTNYLILEIIVNMKEITRAIKIAIKEYLNSISDVPGRLTCKNTPTINRDIIAANINLIKSSAIHSPFLFFLTKFSIFIVRYTI